MRFRFPSTGIATVRAVLASTTVLLVAGMAVPAEAEGPAAADAAKPAAAMSPTTPEVRSYCENIANAAADARFAWQTAKLVDLQARVKAEIVGLETKTAELRSWVEKRQDLERRASEKLVGIYSKMRPETAASQIATLDDNMAAAVLGQLTPQKASAIFNEIVPERAAKLAGIIAGLPPAAEDKKL